MSIVSDFSKAAGDTATAVAFSGQAHGIEIEVNKVTAQSGINSLVLATVTGVPSRNPQEIKKLRGQKIQLEISLPTARFQLQEILTLEKINIDVKQNPPKGQLGLITIKTPTLMPESATVLNGMTVVKGKIHYVDPKRNSRLAVAMEDMQFELKTHIPVSQITKDKPLFIEKIEAGYSSIGMRIVAIDPRESKYVNGHPDFITNCADAVRDIALSSGIADKKKHNDEDNSGTTSILGDYKNDKAF